MNRPNLKGPLVADRKAIIPRFVGVDHADRDMLAIWAEGHRLLASHPRHEVLIRPHEPVGLHGEYARAEVINDLVSAVGLLGDLRI